MKKFISKVLICAMLISVLPKTSFAHEEKINTTTVSEEQKAKTEKVEKKEEVKAEEKVEKKEEIKKFAPESIRKVISKRTADRIKLLMEEVVDKGSGQNAKIKGYRIGGKTGTTLKTKGHGYGKKVFA